MPQLWKYELKDLKEIVEVNLPDDRKCIVAKVTSGDSGKTYWCQILYQRHGGKNNVIAVVCQCPEGFFNWPLTTEGSNDTFFCKHVANLLAFLKEREK
jgi:hypothetical protein